MGRRADGRRAPGAGIVGHADGPEEDLVELFRLTPAAGPRLLCVLVACAAQPLAPVAAAAPPTGLPYDIVYVRMVRHGDELLTKWPDTANPGAIESGSDLMLLHPNGEEEVLVAAGAGAVLDPAVSLDGLWVYYSYIADARPQARSAQKGNLPLSGADLYRIYVPSRAVQRLTFQEFTPNTGAGAWDLANPAQPGAGLNGPGFGVLNLAPCPLSDGRIAFTSNRNGFEPPGATSPTTLQLFVMDGNGANVECITPMSLSGAMGPIQLTDGRILFSSHENQGGIRQTQLWGLWSIMPDGREWAPVVSAFHELTADHFCTQLTGGDIVYCGYYEDSNNGLGALYRMPLAPIQGLPPFYPPLTTLNPQILETIYQGQPAYFQMSFTPWGMHSLTPFTHAIDAAAPLRNDGSGRVGKATHPAAAPSGDLLLVWTPGPANSLERPVSLPAYDGGIYLLRHAAIAQSPDDLVLIKNDPAYNEVFPRPLVSYRAIHGVDRPAVLPWLPNDGTLRPELPAGTPYGLVGASTVLKRETSPGLVAYDGTFFNLLDTFYAINGGSSNFSLQGADAGLYGDDDIWALRVVTMEPNSRRGVGPGAGKRFYSHTGERMRILGEIPLRKSNPDGSTVLDPEGRPDTSFLVKVPADTPFTFQTIDRRGMVLNTAQTWHQVRPGEVRTDCGSCHAHSQPPVPFEQTAASRPGATVYNLADTTPMIASSGGAAPTLDVRNARVVDVEFFRDIRPILQRNCISCHTVTNPTPPGGLALNDIASYNGFPGDYARLAYDRYGRWGIPSVAGDWGYYNASRYVRRSQSRRSLLIWKLYGQRLDGWTNADHPTESVPGDPATFPPGQGIAHGDIDYTGTIMPPPGSGVPPLTDAEKMAFVRWIDLGCPIDEQPGTFSSGRGYSLDDLRPTLTVSRPRPGFNIVPLTAVVIGAADANSGLAAGSLSVVASLSLAGRSAGAELADMATQTAEGVYTLSLPRPLRGVSHGKLTVRVRDAQGNETVVERTFSTPAVGDANGDGRIDPGDLARVLGSWGQADITADFNDDGVVNAGDLAVLLSVWPAPAPRADLNGDARVNGGDLAILLSRWGLPDSQADLNGDGVVNGGDLAVLLSQWTH